MPEHEEMTPKRAVILTVLSFLLIGGGIFLIQGHQYAHLHKRVKASYAASEQPCGPHPVAANRASSHDQQRI